MTTFVVATAAAFVAAIGSAHPGDTVALKPGAYNLTFKDAIFTSVPVRIIAEAAGVTITRLDMIGVTGVTFKGLTFDAPLIVGGDKGGYAGKSTIAFAVGRSAKVTFDHDVFESGPNGFGGTLASEPSGLSIQYSTNVTVSNSTFQHLHNAFNHWQDNGLTMTGNTFDMLRDDAVRGGSSNVLISGNQCYNNHPDGAADTDHPDCIQFWGSGTSHPFTNIVISGNTYTRGTTYPTQCIFMNNPANKTTNDAYENVTVSDNSCTGALGNGIMVQNSRTVAITGNTIVSYCDVLSRLVTQNDLDSTVTISGNVAPRYAIDGKYSLLAPPGNSLNTCKSTAYVIGRAP